MSHKPLKANIIGPPIVFLWVVTSIWATLKDIVEGGIEVEDDSDDVEDSITAVEDGGDDVKGGSDEDIMDGWLEMRLGLLVSRL